MKDLKYVVEEVKERSEIGANQNDPLPDVDKMERPKAWPDPPPSGMNIKEIVAKYLKENGHGELVDLDDWKYDISYIVANYLRENDYEGLANEGTECGCHLDDLMPCGDPHETKCIPAFLVEEIDGFPVMRPGKREDLDEVTDPIEIPFTLPGKSEETADES
jgi:hypothetical protein